MRICNLASGSKGNATLVLGEYTSILIDNGLSTRELKKRCKIVDIDYKSISAIVITHDHVDHIKGVDSLSNELNIPIYIQPQSLNAVKPKFGAFLHAVKSEFIHPIEFEDLSITAFRVNHDAAYTQGFTITDGKVIFTYITDLGHINANIFNRLAQSDYVFIESNYDEEMLYLGTYPPAIKKRILSKNGHLSNEDCANTIIRLYKEHNKNRFMIGHMSQNNNTLEKVQENLSNMLSSCGIEQTSLDITYAIQDGATGIIEI